jgi:hypothetical protein
VSGVCSLKQGGLENADRPKNNLKIGLAYHYNFVMIELFNANLTYEKEITFAISIP